jgi:hypothetical protein
MWVRFFIPDYVSCSGTLDLVTCAALLTSDDSIGFDMERPYSARNLTQAGSCACQSSAEQETSSGFYLHLR